MLIFIAIAIGSFILIGSSFIFGHDTDDVDHDGDVDHDVEPTISFFSVKVIGTMTMGFGAAGAIAHQYGADFLVASLWGLGSGCALAVLMYAVLRMVYAQQSSSLVETITAKGRTATVTTSIGENGVGEIGVTVGGQYMTYLAKSVGGKAIARGRTVTVVEVQGGELLVDDIQQ